MNRRLPASRVSRRCQVTSAEVNRPSTVRMISLSSLGRLTSISPAEALRISRHPVTRMFTPTAKATTGSRRSQPVSAHQQHPDDDAHRGPHVRQQVLAVGGERDRPVPRTGPQEDQGHQPVDDRGHDRDRQTDADVLEGLGVRGTAGSR